MSWFLLPLRKRFWSFSVPPTKTTFSIPISFYIHQTNLRHSFFLYLRFFCPRLIFFINIRISLFFYIGTIFVCTFVPIPDLRFVFYIVCIVCIIIWLELDWFEKLASLKFFFLKCQIWGGSYSILFVTLALRWHFAKLEQQVQT